MTKEGLKLGDKRLPLEPTREQLRDFLGEPSRQEARANVLIFWDELGLIAYSPTNTKRVSVLEVSCLPNSNGRWPARRFRGTVVVGATELTCESAPRELLSGSIFEPAGAHDWIHANVGQINITLLPGGWGLETMSLTFPREGFQPLP